MTTQTRGVLSVPPQRPRTGPATNPHPTHRVHGPDGFEISVSPELRTPRHEEGTR